MTFREVNQGPHRIPTPALLLSRHGTIPNRFLSREEFSTPSLTGSGSVRRTSVCAASTPQPQCEADQQRYRADRLPHCAGALQVRSIDLLVGVASWANHQRGACRGQISRGANLRPKIFALWTGEYPSATSPNSRSRARRNSSWSIGRDATPRQPSAGCPATAARRPMLFTRSAQTSFLVSIDGRLAGGMQMSATGGANTRRPAHPMDTISGGPTGPSDDRSAA